MIGANQRASFRCPETGRLTLTEKECRSEGWRRAVLDVVDDASKTR